MIWILYIPALLVLTQWAFYVSRGGFFALQEYQPIGQLTGKKLLVVYGREVGADSKIEPRFVRLLEEAAEQVQSGRYDAVVLLGGDHHGNGRPYALVAQSWLLAHGLQSSQVMTPQTDPIKGLWAFSCSQEAAVAYRLQQLGATVTMLGERQRTLRYLALAVSRRHYDPKLNFVESSESGMSWLAGMMVTLVDPNEVHVLKYVMLRAKRAIVTARDA